MNIISAHMYIEIDMVWSLIGREMWRYPLSVWDCGEPVEGEKQDIKQFFGLVHIHNLLSDLTSVYSKQPNAQIADNYEEWYDDSEEPNHAQVQGNP